MIIMSEWQRNTKLNINLSWCVFPYASRSFFLTLLFGEICYDGFVFEEIFEENEISSYKIYLILE